MLAHQTKEKIMERDREKGTVSKSKRKETKDMELGTNQVGIWFFYGGEVIRDEGLYVQV